MKRIILFLIVVACTFNVGQPDFYIQSKVAFFKSKGYLVAGRSVCKKQKKVAINKANKLALQELRYQIKLKLSPIVSKIVNKVSFEKGINKFDVKNVILQGTSLKLMQRANTSNKKLVYTPNGYRCSCVAYIAPKRLYSNIDEELKTGEKAILRYLQNNKINKNMFKRVKKYFE